MPGIGSIQDDDSLQVRVIQSQFYLIAECVKKLTNESLVSRSDDHPRPIRGQPGECVRKLVQ